MTIRSLILAAISALALPISLAGPAAAQNAASTGRLEITVLDEATGAPTAFRARLTTEAGERVAAPEQATALMYGTQDRAEGYEAQPDGSFYVGGAFSQALPAGRYRLSITKGYEYLGQEHLLDVSAGEPLARTFRLERWIDMPSRGWYSVDDHIHLRRSPRENPLILTWLAAEDIHVGALLQMGDIHATYFAQYAWGRDGVYQVEDRFLASGQEDPRTHEIGHTISLGADEFVRSTGQYYHFDSTFDRVHELGGLTGYAHQGVLFDGYRGLTLDVLRGRVDFMEVLQFCGDVYPLEVEHYYHFLDLGFRLTATAGSDFPWCGTERGPQIGNARFYTYLDGPLEFERWKNAVRAGHTFVSSGPVIELTVDGAIPGDELRVEPGSTVAVRARAHGDGVQIPLEELELVVHGEVVGRALPGEATGQDRETLTVELALPIDHGVWIAARARGGPNQFAHTTPVYVTTGAGFHNPATARRRLDVSERYLQEIEAEIAAGLSDPLRQPERDAWRFACPRERSGCLGDGLVERIAETRAVIARLRDAYDAHPLATYYPPPDSAGGWRRLTDPADVRRVAGFDVAMLDSAFAFVTGTTKNGGLLVLRDGWLVYERYFGKGHREATANLASIGKSFTSMAVGRLTAERPDLFPYSPLRRRVFTPAYMPPEVFPLSDPRRQEIELGQLLTFTACIRGNAPGFVRGEPVALDPVGPDGWQATLDEVAAGREDVEIGGDTASTRTLWCEPGGGYSYATSSIHLASMMLRHLTGMELEEYVRTRFAEPLGWGRWGWGYRGQARLTHTPGGGGIVVRPTDMLRFGYLLLNEGRWGERELVPAEYVRHAGRQSYYNPHYPYSLQFNVNTLGNVPDLPRDAFWKSGSGGHALYVVPSLGLVVWKLGGRDGQYAAGDTGLEVHPAAAAAAAADPRDGWQPNGLSAEEALHETLKLVIDAIDPL